MSIENKVKNLRSEAQTTQAANKLSTNSKNWKIAIMKILPIAGFGSLFRMQKM